MTTSTSTSSSTASNSTDIGLVPSSQENASTEAGGPTEGPSPASKPDEAGASACGADEGELTKLSPVQWLGNLFFNFYTTRYNSLQSVGYISSISDGKKFKLSSKV